MPKKLAAAVADFPNKYEAMIAEAAYYKAERRGFAPGQELDDWNAAADEVESMLLEGSKAPRKSKVGKKTKAARGKSGGPEKK
jgi:hypothetical protein